jgi:thymidylate synthase ThyX
MLGIARSRIQGKVDYKFTGREVCALLPFFTNGNKRVFFIHNLPTSITSALLAMYSRMKNKRGIRGHFVDNLLPLLLTSFLERFRNHEPKTEEELKNYQKEVTGFLRENDLTTIDKFCEFELEHELVFFDFMMNLRSSPRYFQKIADSPKIKIFLGLYLDSYGHNSIARTANLVLGVEDISILAAKSLEWGRPGSGYIELSTRYVDVSGKSVYPIEEELELIMPGQSANIKWVIDEAMRSYKTWFHDPQDGDGLLPKFLSEHFAKFLNSKDVKPGAFGEACDVAGNFLPCATLTSLGISVSGEAFPELIKHLLLDATYENVALAELILDQA